MWCGQVSDPLMYLFIGAGATYQDVLSQRFRLYSYLACCGWNLV